MHCVGKTRWRRGVLLWAMATAFWGQGVDAATWSMDGGTGYPGDVLYVAIKFKGDGTTAGMDASWVLDESRFTVDAPAGPLPGANGGQCAWDGTRAITSLVFAPSGVLPSTTTTMCTVPLKIRSNAVKGGAAVRASGFSCANATGAPSACTADFAYVLVKGEANASALPPASSLSLNILLDANGPTVDEVLGSLQQGEAEAGALAMFRDVPPVAVRALVSERTTGEAHEFLMQHPHTADAVLERYLVVDYASERDRDLAMESARRDPQVRSASVDEKMLIGDFAEAAPVDKADASSKAIVEYAQYHLDALGIGQTWSTAGGWGLIGVPDNGIYPGHPELRSFTGTDSIGGSFVEDGNYLPGVSRNHGGQGQPASDLHEGQKAIAQPSDTSCDPGNTGFITPAIAGHGTHVAGLAAANAGDAMGSSGTCRHCGLAVRKVSGVTCVQAAPNVFVAYPSQKDSAIADAVKDLRRVGVQVISASFGSDSRYCTDYVDSGPGDTDPMCAALGGAIEDDVLVVAAAGNNLSTVNFPAANQSVVAVGGSNEAGDRWNYLALPGGVQNCPYYNPVTALNSKTDCGSNASIGPIGPLGHRKLELMAPATGIRSTFYPGWTWGTAIGCGDGFGDGNADDGSGLCTGTSMSTPEVSGIFALLRSAHPLLKAGDPFDASAYGMRDVVRETTARTRGGLGWDWYVGYGTPDTSAALAKVLGKVLDTPMRNRLTPLFRLYSSGANDYASVATPQLAIALALRQSSNLYKTAPAANEFIGGKVIPGYSALPNVLAGAPRAGALVMTTESNMIPGAPPLVPLFLLDKAGPGNSRDHILLTSTSRVQSAAAAGYTYLGRQGFVYQYCAPSPTCSPPSGVEVLHLKCKTAANDCAAFLESDRTAFELAGYTALLSGMPSQLGYAFPVKDTDGDTLADGGELLLGTAPNIADSDGDGISDGVEYPFAGVQVSDPCVGPNVMCPRSLAHVFGDGFE